MFGALLCPLNSQFSKVFVHSGVIEHLPNVHGGWLESFPIIMQTPLIFWMVTHVVMQSIWSSWWRCKHSGWGQDRDELPWWLHKCKDTTRPWDYQLQHTASHTVVLRSQLLCTEMVSTVSHDIQMIILVEKCWWLRGKGEIWVGHVSITPPESRLIYLLAELTFPMRELGVLFELRLRFSETVQSCLAGGLGKLMGLASLVLETFGWRSPMNFRTSAVTLMRHGRNWNRHSSMVGPHAMW